MLRAKAMRSCFSHVYTSASMLTFARKQGIPNTTDVVTTPQPHTELATLMAEYREAARRTGPRIAAAVEKRTCGTPTRPRLISPRKAKAANLTVQVQGGGGGGFHTSPSRRAMHAGREECFGGLWPKETDMKDNGAGETGFCRGIELPPHLFTTGTSRSTPLCQKMIGGRDSRPHLAVPKDTQDRAQPKMRKTAYNTKMQRTAHERNMRKTAHITRCGRLPTTQNCARLRTTKNAQDRAQHKMRKNLYNTEMNIVVKSTNW
jgi:hypothetical protein